MKRNTDPTFAGIVAIKEKQRQQLETFERAVADADWPAIHHDHYDWWMFPTDEPSSYGFTWTVYQNDVAELKQDSEYVARYLRGVELLALAWGWDLRHAHYILNPQPGQCWQHWPIRLYKAARSVKLFGFAGEFASLRTLAEDLMSKGESMYYHRDLSWLFSE
jgi:hypothetical protein